MDKSRKFIKEYLDYVGCPVRQKPGLGEAACIPVRLKPLKALRKTFGNVIPLERPDFGAELLKLAKDHGATAHFRLAFPDDISVQDTIADCAKNMDAALFARVSDVEILRLPMLLQIYKAALYTDARFDRLICILTDCYGNNSLLGLSRVEGFLSHGRWGRLVNGGGADPSDPVFPRQWVEEAVSAGYRVAGTTAKRLLWKLSRQSRALLGEELRQIEGFYAELTDDAMEPLRNLHRRMAEASARRADARYHETFEKSLRDMRKLKSQVSQEESKYYGAREDIIEEKSERIREAAERYRPRLECSLVQLAAISADVPRLTIRESESAPEAIHIFFNPVIESPMCVSRGNNPAPAGFTRNTKLQICRRNHIFDMTTARQCRCGNYICPECEKEDEGYSCAYCGDPLCRECRGDQDSPSGTPICGGCIKEVVTFNFFGIGD